MDSNRNSSADSPSPRLSCKAQATGFAFRSRSIVFYLDSLSSTQPLSYIECFFERYFNILPEHAIVTHFPSPTWFQLPVQVQLGSRVLQNQFPIWRTAGVPKIPQQIHPSDRTE